MFTLEKRVCGARGLYRIRNANAKSRSKGPLEAVGLRDAPLEYHGSLSEPPRGNYSCSSFDIIKLARAEDFLSESWRVPLSFQLAFFHA